MNRFTLSAMIASLILVLAISPVFAIGSPETITINSSRAFTDVLETGDFLFVTHFTLIYADCDSTVTTGCPDENIEQAYLGHLFSGLTVLRSSLVVLADSHTFEGYGEGVFSVYVNAADATTFGITDATDFFTKIEGNPAVFGSTPPLASVAVSSETPQSLLGLHILNRAENIGQSWDQSLLTNADSVLSADGEAYFNEAVPGLRLLAPQIFDASVDSAQFSDKDFNTNVRDDMSNFGAGTQFVDQYNAGFDGLNTEYGVPSGFSKTLLLLTLTAIAMTMVGRATNDGRVGALAFPIFVPVGVVMGFGNLELVAIGVLFSAIALSYLIFLKSA